MKVRLTLDMLMQIVVYGKFASHEYDGCGEDLFRESGIPYMIVRPCALAEEPAGADLIFDQGDNIMGKTSREEVARICVAALESPHACAKTFNVAIPHSSC